MLIMKRRYERAMRMSEHAVDDVFEEAPREQSSNENQRGGNHIMILGWLQPLSNAAR